MVFDIEKIENILEARAKNGFSGYPITLKESELKEVIAELKEARQLKAIKR